MPYVITPGCCSDASCVAVCPVNCIHPTPDEPDFGTTTSLYVDPDTCIDCGACADACPVDAITPADLLRGPDTVFVERNRDFFRDREGDNTLTVHFPATLPFGLGTPQVAVVGTGPAAQYATDLLLRSVGAEVTMFDRLPVSGGLLRYGVAPDHPATRRLGERFAGFLQNPKLHLVLGAEIGTDVSTDELAAAFDAVVYATGAAHGRTLGIPGEQRPGSISATDFVAWYNAHPDAELEPTGLHGERTVIVGNGNVALDVARIVLGEPDELAATDIADHALAALRTSTVREVVICGRRGPADAACSVGELHALRSLPGIELVVADRPGLTEQLAAADPAGPAGLIAELPRLPIDWSAAPPAGRRIVLAFDLVARSVSGDGTADDAVAGIEFVERDAAPGDTVTVPAGLLVKAIGYQGHPVVGLPFDEDTCTIPNRHGRVLDATGGEVVPGRYVVGWIKRGATGGIGANRQDAADTVAALRDDIIAGRVRATGRSAKAFRARLTKRLPAVVDRRGVLAIDAAERSRGASAGRPRVKFASRDALVAAARPTRAGRSSRSAGPSAPDHEASSV